MTDTTVRYVRLSGGPEAEAKCGASGHLAGDAWAGSDAAVRRVSSIHCYREVSRGSSRGAGTSSLERN